MPTGLFDTNWRVLWGDDLASDVGCVYTRPEIVDLILDVAGYSPGSTRLADHCILEPSCGSGAFLVPIVDRLLNSESLTCGAIEWNDGHLERAILATDLSQSAVSSARSLAKTLLVKRGCPEDRAEHLAVQWIQQADFLLAQVPGRFRWIVGNPPYVRLEDLPKQVLAAYRSQYQTLTERADLYVAFFERGLQLLKDDGSLTFICANRFTKNKYGTTLRRLIAKHFHVRAFINLEHTQPFVEDVSAYPAIISIDRERGNPTLAGDIKELTRDSLQDLHSQFSAAGTANPSLGTFRDWYPGGEAWRTTSGRELEVLSRLEREHPLLEDSGPATYVGIGVATGADNVFVLPSRTDEVEESRQLPLAMSSDVKGSEFIWSGHYLINPFEDDAALRLVDLGEYPKLSRYLAERSSVLRSRYVANARPLAWYRTIDRIWTSRVTVPKLLIPDIQSGGSVAYDVGTAYPHHNLYWVTSQSWNLRALQALLRSSFVETQLRCLSVQMRGGSIRYQAQSLRKLRIPDLNTLDAATINRLVSVSRSGLQAEIDDVARVAYRLELSVLQLLAPSGSHQTG